MFSSLLITWNVSAHSLILISHFIHVNVKMKVGHFYSDAYVSQTRDQQRFTMPQVAADWHEFMLLTVET